MGLVYLQRYVTEKGTLVACCDAEIMGRTFRQGRMRLSLETRFYGTATLAVEEALNILEPAEMLNLAGREIVEAAITRGLVHPDAIIRVEGVPHVQVLRI